MRAEAHEGRQFHKTFMRAYEVLRRWRGLPAQGKVAFWARPRHHHCSLTFGDTHIGAGPQQGDEGSRGDARGSGCQQEGLAFAKFEGAQYGPYSRLVGERNSFVQL